MLESQITFRCNVVTLRRVTISWSADGYCKSSLAVNQHRLRDCHVVCLASQSLETMLLAIYVAELTEIVTNHDTAPTRDTAVNLIVPMNRYPHLR